MRIVLDTNVLVSALINPYGKPAAVLNAILSRFVVPCYDARMIDEYERVLRRPRFQFSNDDIRSLLDFFLRVGSFGSPEPVSIKLPDLSDLPFVEVARASGAPIVTGNAKHFPENLARVMSPAMLLDVIHKRY